MAVVVGTGGPKSLRVAVIFFAIAVVLQVRTIRVWDASTTTTARRTPAEAEATEDEIKSISPLPPLPTLTLLPVVELNISTFWDSDTFQARNAAAVTATINLTDPVFCPACLYNPETFKGVTCQARAEYYASRYRPDGNVAAAQKDVMAAEPIRCVQKVNMDSMMERRASLGLKTSTNDTSTLLNGDPWFLEGTSVLRENEGAITLANICLHQASPDNRPQFVSYNPIGGAAAAPIYLHHAKTSPGTETLLTHTYPIDWITWRDIIVHPLTQPFAGLATAPRVEEPTLFVPDWRESSNLGHCLNDLTFSIAMDDWMIENTMSTTGNATRQDTPTYDATHFDHVPRYYPRFVHASPAHIYRQKKATMCMDMLQTRFGFLGEQVTSAEMGERSVTLTNATTLCFASLTVPKLTALRHRRSPQADASLKQLQARSFAVLRETAGLTEHPWPRLQDSEVPTILLYDRTDAGSRHLVDASLIKEHLETNYKVRVDHWNGTSWASLNHTSQAQLFNRHRYILSPHGAQFINALTARPGTKVLEIQCTVPNRRWAQHQRWFSAWAHIANLDWNVWMETDGCRDPLPDGPLRTDYSPAKISVNLTAFVDLAATHFGLLPSNTYTKVS